MEDYKYCKKCGATCSVDYKFCPNCGANLKENKCGNCGAVLVESAKFCVNCGARVEETSEHKPQTKAESVEVGVADEKEETNSTATNENYFDSVFEARRVTPAKKSGGAGLKNNSYAIRLIKNASILILCTILFALSFCNIITVKVDRYIEDFLDFEIDDCDMNISAVDMMDAMFATTNEDNIDKYEDELSDIYERLTESLKKDYNSQTGKFILSAKSKKLISDTLICYLKVYLVNEEVKGSAMYNNVIIAGTLSFLNVLFCASMLIVSIISVVLVALKKRNKVAKFLYAMPAYLFISLMILFITKTTVGVGAVAAGAMGATLFFEIVAIAVTVLLIFSSTKRKVLKNAIPKLVSIAVSLIICACLFAPVFTAKYDLVLANKASRNTYTVSVDAGGLITYLPPSEVEEIGELSKSDYEEIMEIVEESLKDLSDVTLYEFNHSVGEVTTRIIMSTLIYANGNYGEIGALSIGYYVLLLVFMLFGAFAVWSVACLFKDKSAMYSMLIVAMVLIVIALACSIGWICVMNYHLENLDLSFTAGGSLISAFILTFMTLIFPPIFKAIASKEKPIISKTESFSDEKNFELAE